MSQFSATVNSSVTADPATRPVLPAAWEARVHQLEATFQAVARERMDGVPVLNPALRVQALGFEALPRDAASVQALPLALGVLITPWFMNLLRLPLVAVPEQTPGLLPVGHQAERRLAGLDFAFTGACEPALGCFESCSLFSPMFEFADQAAAVATAQAVLAMLKTPAQPATVSVPATAGDAPASRPVPSRRGFLFGRAERRP